MSLDDNPRRLTDFGGALKAIALLAVVVLFNTALYIAIYRLVDIGWRDPGSIFPALVLFLSLALSIGILLILGMGEKIIGKASTDPNDPWTKKIGATPVMVVVAVIVSLAAGFSPLAQLVMPPQESFSKKLMLADLALTCAPAVAKDDPAQATVLLVVISTSDDIQYIREVKKILTSRDRLMSLARREDVPDLQLIAKKEGSPDYELLLREFGSESLQTDMSDPAKWVAYTIPISAPNVDTLVPIP
jgi:hypothetical protein